MSAIKAFDGEYSSNYPSSLNINQKIMSSFLWTLDRFRFFELYSYIKSSIQPVLLIIMYHRVGPFNELWAMKPTDPLLFEKEIRYIKDNYDIISFDILDKYLKEDKQLPRRTAIITFDDGYKDNYEYAYPILKKYNVNATIFLATGNIGRDNLFWWDKLRYVIWNTKKESLKLNGLKEVPLSSKKDKFKFISSIESYVKRFPEKEKDAIINDITKALDVDIPKGLGKNLTLSWEEVDEMSHNGIDFGAHTVSHPILTKTRIEDARQEIMQSKEEIQRRTGRPVIAFSYPNGKDGDYDSKIIEILKDNKFGFAVTTTHRLANYKKGLFTLSRVYGEWDFSSFKFLTSGLFGDIKEVVHKGNGNDQ